jgi:16S rRNA (uracil1498-N3)-methyltransferase
MASVRRVVSSSRVDGARIVLDDRAAHYVGHVLRLAAGATVDVMDGDGRVSRGTLEFVDGIASVRDVVEVAGHASSSGVTLCVALIKAQRFEWIVEKAAELGVDAVVPIITERTVIRPEDGRVEKKLERWQRISDEAVRQCEGPRRVEVRAPLRFVQAVADFGAHAIFADETARNGAWDAVGDDAVALFIGPEGGFTGGEREALREAGARGVGLGPRLLRAETATVAALAMLGGRRWGLL